MAEITAQMVKELRTATNAGVNDCKKALVDADGDFDKAVEILRKKGLASAAKKASRDTRALFNPHVSRRSFTKCVGRASTLPPPPPPSLPGRRASWKC